jgi:hypothetical protein
MSTPVTLLDAPAEGSRAAVANITQGFALFARQHVIPTRQQSAVMSADNVGHLRPTWIHDSIGGKWRSSESSGLSVARTATSATCR